MMKWLLIPTAIGAAFYLFKDKFAQGAVEFLKEHFSIRVSGAKVHRLDKSGLDLRLTTDLINLSSLEATASQLKADVYYMKNGSPSPLATTTISSQFKIKSNDTTRISDLKVSVPYQNLLFNLSIFTAPVRQFKVVVSCVVNGHPVKFNQNITA